MVASSVISSSGDHVCIKLHTGARAVASHPLDQSSPFDAPRDKTPREAEPVG